MSELQKHLQNICMIHGIDTEIFEDEEDDIVLMDKMAEAIYKNFTGKQLVSETAIKWLFDNHKEAYIGFYERV